MFVWKGRLEMTEPSQEGRVRVGRESYPVTGENKKVSADRPLDQGRASSGVGPTIAARGGREVAISGATGPPVDPPNLSLVFPPGGQSSSLVVSPGNLSLSMGDRMREHDVGSYRSSQNVSMAPTFSRDLSVDIVDAPYDAMSSGGSRVEHVAGGFPQTSTLPQGVTPHDFGALMSRHADDSWISLDDDVSVRNRLNVGNENLLLLCREALKGADKNGVVDTDVEPGPRPTAFDVSAEIRTEPRTPTRKILDQEIFGQHVISKPAAISGYGHDELTSLWSSSRAPQRVSPVLPPALDHRSNGSDVSECELDFNRPPSPPLRSRLDRPPSQASTIRSKATTVGSKASVAVLGEAFAGLTSALREAMQDVRESAQSSVNYERQLAEAEKRFAKQQVQFAQQLAEAEADKRVMALQFQLEKADGEKKALQQQVKTSSAVGRSAVTAPTRPVPEPVHEVPTDVLIEGLSHPLEASAMSVTKNDQNINVMRTHRCNTTAGNAVINVSPDTVSANIGTALVDTTMLPYSFQPRPFGSFVTMGGRDISGPMPHSPIQTRVFTQIVRHTEMSPLAVVTHDVMSGSLMTSRPVGPTPSADLSMHGATRPLPEPSSLRPSMANAVVSDVVTVHPTTVMSTGSKLSALPTVSAESVTQVTPGVRESSSAAVLTPPVSAQAAIDVAFQSNEERPDVGLRQESSVIPLVGAHSLPESGVNASDLPVPSAPSQGIFTTASESVPVVANVVTQSARTAVTATLTRPSSAVTGGNPTVPVVVVRQLQPLRPYSGTTSWKSFREYFLRICKANSWQTDEEKLTYLVLALDGAAIEILKDFPENTPSTLAEVWDALERRFGSINEVQVALRLFDSRRQTEAETLQEFETALKVLHKQAYPNATNEQRDSDLKRKFQDGVLMPELAQHLRVHCRTENFSNTVLRAREFSDAVEASRPRRTVRSLLVPEHQEKQNDSNNNTILDMQPLINSITAAIDKSVNEKMKNTVVDKKTDISYANKQTIGAPPPLHGNGRRTDGQGEGSRKTVVKGNGSQFQRNQSLPRDFGVSNEPPDAHNGFKRGSSFYPGRFDNNRPRSMSVGSRNQRPWRFQQNRGRIWTNSENQNVRESHNFAGAHNSRGAQKFWWSPKLWWTPFWQLTERKEIRMLDLWGTRLPFPFARREVFTQF